ASTVMRIGHSAFRYGRCGLFSRPLPALSCDGSPMQQPFDSPTNSRATTAIHVRRALPRDAAALAQLRYAFRLEPRPAKESLEAFAARCGNWMRPRLGDDARWTAWLGEREGKIVGNLWVQIIVKIPNPGPESELHAYLSNFFVVPAERNTGVGARLLSAA